MDFVTVIGQFHYLSIFYRLSGQSPYLILNPRRKGWSEAFQKMNKAGDDKLLIPVVFEEESLLNDPENDWKASKNSAKSKKHP